MKIIFAIKTLEHSVGGAERITSCLANAMHERGHTVSILSFDPENAKGFYSIHDNIKRLFVPAYNSAQKTKISELPHLVRGLRKSIVDEKPDIVIAVMHSMFIPLQLALLGTGIKVIFSEHTVPKYYSGKRLEFIALTMIGLLAKRVTIASEAVKSLYPLLLQWKMTVIPNPVFSNFGKADVIGSKERKTILTVGRLDPDKDHKILIDAFALLQSEYPEWDLKIVGEGPERANLEHEIKHKQLQNRVTLPGTIRNICEAYQDAQLFVMPSRYESFGLVTAEAMTHALPVIGFADCSGTNDLVSDGETGILVGTRSATALKEALQNLMNDPEKRLRFSENGQNKSRIYDQNHIVGEWEKLILRSA